MKIKSVPPHILYPGMVIGILLMSVIAQMTIVYKATSDGGAQVVPDYYEKASHWDDEQAREAAARDRRATKSEPDSR